MSKAKDFLKSKMIEDFKLIGKPEHLNQDDLEHVASTWMDDKNNSKHRFDVIKKELPEAHKILDMAAGAGTFVFYGLLNGYDCYGIDPEDWKFEFNSMKIEENNYPQNWIEKFQKGYGEKLPYENNSFDLVSSYQTLEHVQDIKKCLSEMCRVVKMGGGIHIMCPDYRSTYEGHYNIAWLPLFPRKLANIYLKLRGRNTAYLKTLNYITKPSILKYLSDIKIEQNLEIEIVDLNKKYFIERLESKKLFFLSNFYFLYLTLMYLKKLFKSENANKFVYKN